MSEQIQPWPVVMLSGWPGFLAGRRPGLLRHGGAERAASGAPAAGRRAAGGLWAGRPLGI